MAALPVTPKDMLSKALEMGVCFHKGPVLGNFSRRPWETPFLGPSREVKNFFYQKNFQEELERQIKEGSGNWQLSP
jgi:hypothetical protein